MLLSSRAIPSSRPRVIPGIVAVRRLLFFATLLLGNGVRAQNVASYHFSSAAGTYTPISGGTVLLTPGANWSSRRFTVNLPSPFWFAGHTYATMYVSSNGFISLGSMMGANEFSPLSSSAAYAGAISPFGTTLTKASSSTSEIRWVMEGNEAVVQWKDVRRKVSGNQESFSFQARLDLTTGVIRYVYSDVAAQSRSKSKQPQIGLRGPTNAFATNVKNRRVNTGVETWAVSLPGTAKNSTVRFSKASPTKAPQNGQTYLFTPGCVVATATVTTAIVCNGDSAIVTVSGTGGTLPYTGTGTFLVPAGPWSQVVTDATGCSTTASITVTEPEPLDVNVSLTALESGCQTSDAIVQVNASGGVAPYSGTGSHQGLTAGNAMFYVTDANGCTAGSAFTILEPDADNDGSSDCADQCPNDPNKITPGACGCGHSDMDSDNDGLLDCVDPCPNGPNPGSPCDDGDAATLDDAIDANCACHGTAPAATVVLSLTTDSNGGQTSWEIIPAAGGSAVCGGSGYPGNTNIDLPCPITSGDYVLRVMDSFGDGMCCVHGNGGYVLRTSDGRRIIDNSADGTFTSVSSVSQGFSLPLGTDRLTTNRCDREDLLPSEFIQAAPNEAVRAQFGVSNANSGYQFWIFDPDGTYSRRVLVTHANASYMFPVGADRCSYLRIADVTANPIPLNILLNVRVRSVVSGVYGPFGPACRMKLNLPGSCPTTQLVADQADPHNSCGITNVLLDGSRWLYAVPVSAATMYQFEFIDGGYQRSITSPGSGLLLTQWAQMPLEYGGKSYQVRVRVSFDNGTTWCPFGPACMITTAFTPPSGQREAVIVGSDPSSLRIWPNPSRDGSIHVLLNGLAMEEESVHLTMIDLRGRILSETDLSTTDGRLDALLSPDRQLPQGTYLLTLRTVKRSWTERVVVE